MLRVHVGRAAAKQEARDNLKEKSKIESELKGAKSELKDLMSRIEEDQRQEVANHGRESQQLRSRLLMDKKAHELVHEMEARTPT